MLVQQTPEQQQHVTETIRRFSEMQLNRNTFANQWQEVSELVAPNYRNTFYYGNYNTPGEKKTYRQVDSTAMLALGRFAAILDSLLTPRNMTWHQLEANDPVLNKDRQVKLWFEDSTRRLFRLRYAPEANFASQNLQTYGILGAFGTGSTFIDALDSRKGFRYRSLPLGETFFSENHQGQIDAMIRWFRLTPRQALQKWGDRVPDAIRAKADSQTETLFDFLHAITPREDYDPTRLDAKGKKWRSCYVSMEGSTLVQEGGYNTFPVACSRYEQAPGEVYGRSPAMAVLPAIKTLNAQKTTFLKQGHRAADPVLLTTDDGIIDMSLRPGAINKGGMSYDGKPLVSVLPSGNIQISEEMMGEERQIINDAFLVTLFQILTENPTMTATEVQERINEKGILLAPTVGRQQSEYLGPLIDRELDLASEMGLLLPMPQALREARGEYSVRYTSPLSRQQRAQEAAGFLRTVESALEIVNATQNPGLLDCFDFDTALPEIADISGVPASWMRSSDAMDALRQQRAEAQDQQNKIQAAPAAAAMIKAHAAAAKAGVPTPLSAPPTGAQPAAAPPAAPSVMPMPPR